VSDGKGTMPNTLVMIHGYSDKGKSFATWRDRLKDRYKRTEQICICDYVSLTNEVTIKDLAEGFDFALQNRPGLKNDEDFDAIVHSTGMLVIRAWLTTYPARRSRLKHLIGIAPATFGSPLAKKGRSWIGAIFKGSKHLGPDFLAAGNMILDGLELASPFTWALAETDMLGDAVYYGTTEGTPYVHIFCGTDGYGGLESFVNTPGSDGTVRQAGAGFNVRKIVLDLTKNQSILNPGKLKKKVSRWRLDTWKNANIPVHLINDVNHGTILTDPTDELVALVRDALDVDDAKSFAAWLKSADAPGRITNATKGRWQQFIVRVFDERHDPVTDYNLQLFTDRNDPGTRIPEFDKNVEVYSKDSSFRCFLVDLDNFQQTKTLWLSVLATSGSEYIEYESFQMDPEIKSGPVTSRSEWDAWLDLSGLMKRGDERGFMSPFTTTLVEIYLDREPSDKLVKLS
jgi:pimeloyl-ACP methyl ester carboxylesterase